MNGPCSKFHQQWDLNTGLIVRKFTAHGAQLVGIAVRPITSGYTGTNISTAARSLAEDTSAVHFRPAHSMQVTTNNKSGSALGGSGAVSNITSTLASGNIAGTQSDMMHSHAATSMQQTAESDAKSEMSYDPLFDDEPDADADGEPDSENAAQWQQTHGMNVSSSQGAAPLGIPRSTSQPNSRAALSSAAVPKNAPPLLDSIGYSTFSADLLMTASIDGQIVLWDKRVNTPYKGVGRLEMSEKTPPWCVSVCIIVVADHPRLTSYDGHCS